MIVNNTEKIEPLLAQMKQWSILSNTLNYIQYERYQKNYHSLGISAVNKYKSQSDAKEDRVLIELRLWSNTENIKGRISRCIQRNSVGNSKHHKV